jgi:D-arabinose 1-dehydrogenase-like Zn-dependent alcohol dehydrogenase
LIGGQKAIVGSAIGGRPMMKEMLQFAAEHDVRPRIETLPMDEVNEGVSKVENNEVRYRVVLEA